MNATLDAAPAGPGGAAGATGGASWRTRILPTTDGRGGWWATLVVGLVAGLLRFVRLDLPAGKIFDELYYACDAQNLLRFGVEVATENSPTDSAVGERCEPTGQPGFVVHPPLGKWAIALGLRLFGQNEFGWRVAAAVAGTLMVVVLVRVTRRMTGSTVLACFAGLLLALDGLHLVQSRIAMLDVFVAAWVLGAFACLVADRDAIRRRLAGTDDADLAGRGPALGLRPWRLAAGLCLGAGLATKWSAVYYVVLLVLLAVAWEVGARRTAGVRRPLMATLRRTAPGLVTALLVLPLLVYLLSWSGWFLGDAGWDRQWAAQKPASGVVGLVPDTLRSWVQYHREILSFHSGLSTPHPYQSRPVGWLLLVRPVSYYYPQDIGSGDYGCQAESCAREVLALGTPAIWWVSIPMLLALLWLWVSRRDWRAAAVLAMVLTAIVPWIRDDLGGRTMFLFYALPAVPFMCLGLALVAGWAIGGPDASPRRRRFATLGTGVYLATVVLNLAYLYPVLTAQTLPYDAWYARMWLTSWI